MALKPPDMIASLTNPKALRRIAGDTYFARGKAYFAQGAVSRIRWTGHGIRAEVDGTRRYRVRLSVDDDYLDHDCSCPLGDDGLFCKHRVAAALAWHDKRIDLNVGGEGDGVNGAIRRYLQGLDKDALIELVLESCKVDDHLQMQLSIRAEPASTGAKRWKEALADALPTEEYYGDADVEALNELALALEVMLDAGHTTTVIGLTRYGIREVNETVEYNEKADDLFDFAGEMFTLHLRACRAAPPDPEDLAEWLFECQFDTEYVQPANALHDYAEELGDTGLAAYRKLAEQTWATIPPRRPGRTDEGSSRYRWAITRIMEELAHATGNLEDRVAVLSRDLSSPANYLKIAQLYSDAADHARALQWAERGWRVLPPGWPAEPLRLFLVGAYRQAGRHDDALVLTWENYAMAPSLPAYRELEDIACSAGQWPDWRRKALDLVRSQSSAVRLDGNSMLVEIHLYEEDPETAWSAARDGGCSDHLWLRLAEARARDHPVESLAVYRNHIDRLLTEPGRYAYEQTVRLLHTMLAVYEQAGMDEDFHVVLVEIRATHRRKRNLMAMLKEHGW